MSVSLVKGQKLSLTKEAEGLGKGLGTVVVGLGWDMAKKGLFGGTYNIDCDASAIVLGANDSYKDVVYYGHRYSQMNCITHHGDNLTGAGDGDDEQITVDLANMPSSVEKVAFVVNIYDCANRRQHFGMVKNAFIRIVDKSTGKEICKYNLSENYDGKTAMVFGEVYKSGSEWKFNAVGQGTTDKSISDLTRRYK